MLHGPVLSPMRPAVQKLAEGSEMWLRHLADGRQVEGEAQHCRAGGTGVLSREVQEAEVLPRTLLPRHLPKHLQSAALRVLHTCWISEPIEMTWH